MKCTLSSSALSGALGLVSRAVSGRSTLPILSNVLLETTDEGLRLTATNLDLCISATVPATVVDDGRITVPAKLITDYVNSLAESPCTLDLDPKTQILKISCGVHRSTLHGIDATEFPPPPASAGQSIIEADAAAFQSAVAQTALAASSDDSRPVLTGVLLQLSGDRLTLAATDGHRLAVRTLAVRGDEEALPGDVVISARHLLEAVRAITPRHSWVRLSLSPSRSHVVLTVGDVEVVSRLLEGTYPNYSQVIPAETTTKVILPTAELLREVRTAAVLARDAANVVRLAAGDGTLTLQAQTAEVGTDEAPLVASVDGDTVQIAFNARYLVDALGALDADDVELGFNGTLSPGVLRPVGRDDYLYVVMPVRVPM